MSQSTRLPPREHVAGFDVDAQYTFTPECPAELPVPDAPAIVPELNAQAAYASRRLGSKDAHSPHAIWTADSRHPPLSPVAGKNVDVRWPAHAVPGTRGFELISGLPPVTAYDFFVWKGIEPDMHPYGACWHDLARTLSTGVIEYLRSRDIETVIVGGLATDYCVKHTVLELREAGFDVVVNHAAIRGVAPETTREALHAMAQAGARFIDRASALDRPPRESP